MGDSATADRAVIIERHDTDARAPAVVTLRAVDQSGHLGRTVRRRPASLPDVASAAALGGDALAVVDTSGVVRRYEARTRPRSSASRSSVLTSRPSLVALQHDRLGLVIGSSVAIIDTSDGKLRKLRIVNGPTGPGSRAVAAFPDGGKLAASMGDGSLVIVDVDTGKQVARTMTIALSGLAIAPDGRLMAQVDVLTGVVSHPGRDDVAARRPGCWWLRASSTTSRGSTAARLATASTDGSVHYWDIATRKRLAELPHGSVVDNVFARRRDGRVLRGRRSISRVGSRPAARRSRAACAEAAAT